MSDEVCDGKRVQDEDTRSYITRKLARWDELAKMPRSNYVVLEVRIIRLEITVAILNERVWGAETLIRSV